MFAQIAAWLVLFFVLHAFVSDQIRFEASAFGGLLFLGLLGVAKLNALFIGFQSPALFTIIAVLVMSDGIVKSGVLTGLGKWIARHIYRRIHDAYKFFTHKPHQNKRHHRSCRRRARLAGHRAGVAIESTELQNPITGGIVHGF